MIEINLKVNDLEKTIQFLDDKYKNQIPFATSRAINTLATMIWEGERLEISKVFNRPTPATQKAPLYKTSTKTNLKAEVFLNYESGKNPPEKYLRAEIFGGARKMKGFEKLLQTYGNMPQGRLAVPGTGAKLDQYGNISGSDIVKILSYLRAFPEVGYIANRNAKRKLSMSKKARNYFLLPRWRGKLLPGIYERSSSYPQKITPVLIFVSKANYARLYDFFGVAARIFEENWEWVFKQELENAINTAR